MKKVLWFLVLQAVLKIGVGSLKIPVRHQERDIKNSWLHASSDQKEPPIQSVAQALGDIHKFRVDQEMYDRQMPPPKINGTGIPVKFSVLIFSVRGINEIQQEITIEMRLQMWWQDLRLESWKAHVPPGKKFVSITHKVDGMLWHPDITVDFVKEIIQPELLGASPVSLRFYSNGFLRTSTRVTLRMACPMAFYYYPVDQQACHVDLRSYSHSHDILDIQWNDHRNKLALLKPGMDLPNFELGVDMPETFMITTQSSNVYSSIRFSILLKRKLSYHFIQTYVPSTLFVIISWLSFLVPQELVPGRMAICMTTLLSLSTMFSGIRQNIPKVSYIKALDIWMVACIFFVFLTLVEYAVILRLRSKISKETARQQRKSNATINLIPSKQVRKESEASSRGNLEVDAVERTKYAEVVKLCEQYTWIFCITLFVVFNFIYWPWLLTSAGYYDKFGEDLYYKFG